MFSKVSRYRNLPDVVTVDAKGRALASKSLRLLPEVSGDFLHVVEEGDRLDHLAYKYYEQPRTWWRIADANPAFLSPQALLGTDSRATVQIPLTWSGSAPPWSGLLQALRKMPGMEVVRTGTPEQIHATVEVVQGALAFDLDPALTAALDASVRAQQITPDLAAALSVEGLSVPTDVRMEKPDAVTWRITDRETGQIYTIQHFETEGLLNVYESVLRYHWSVTVTYDRINVSTGDLLDLVEAQGFSAESPRTLGRIGKSIVIPPRGT